MWLEKWLFAGSAMLCVILKILGLVVMLLSCLLVQCWFGDDDQMVSNRSKVTGPTS